MTQITATWIQDLILGEELPMCSRSERDEIFDVGSWQYELPEGYQFLREAPKEADEEVFEIVGNGKVIGYAAKPVAYVMVGEIFASWDEINNHQDFHPNDWQAAYSQSQAKILKAQQIELLEEGGYGD